MTTHSPPPLNHAPAIFDELQTSLCFPFPGCINSRAELVPSHGASRRWLGDYTRFLYSPNICYKFLTCLRKLTKDFRHALSKGNTVLVNTARDRPGPSGKIFYRPGPPGTVRENILPPGTARENILPPGTARQ